MDSTNPLSQNNHCLVSVIIPTYNRKKQCLRAIESALNQQDCQAEIIVIDDGSTDSTKDYLKPYTDRIHYLRQNNQGASAARNAGLDAANGDYIAFLDADDYFTIEHLKDSIELLDNQPNIDFVFSNTVRGPSPETQATTFLDGKELPGLGIYHKGMSIEILSKDTWLQIIKGNIIPPSTSVMRRQVLEKQRFNTGFPVANDTEFFSRVLQGKVIAFINKIGAYCEEGSDNLTNRNNNHLRTKLKLTLIKNHLKEATTKKDKKQLNEINKYFLRQLSRHYWHNDRKLKALALHSKSWLFFI